MLPSGVQRGALYQRAGESDQHSVATEYDTRSEFKLDSRLGGHGRDLTIVGSMPNPTDHTNDHGSPSPEDVVTLSDVNPPIAGAFDYVIREGLSAFVNAQRTTLTHRGSDVSGATPRMSAKRRLVGVTHETISARVAV